MAHLFADITSHGLGHLAQAAPVLNALRAARPDLRLTVRSGLPYDKLALRLHGEFRHIHDASDFGFVMHNALDVDLPASAERYRAAHADWAGRVSREADSLRGIAPDLVFTDVSYLPLAGAAAAGIPAIAMSSLNWADLFAAYFRRDAWAKPIHGQMLDAYRSAKQFLRATPGMPMAALSNNLLRIGPLAVAPTLDRAAVARRLGLPADRRWVLVALGGFDFPLPVDRWPAHDHVLWLQADVLDEGVHFTDLLAAVDAVVTKPGYGTFTEATVFGVPVLYLPRPDWPEQPFLVDWLHACNRAAPVTREQAERGDLLTLLEALWAVPAPTPPQATGVAEAVGVLLELLKAS